MPTNTKYQYINFIYVRSTGKTTVWWCVANDDGTKLGVVKWYSRWRQYCYFPNPSCVYHGGCLNDIADFLSQLMKERKEERGCMVYQPKTSAPS